MLFEPLRGYNILEETRYMQKIKTVIEVKESPELEKAIAKELKNKQGLISLNTDLTKTLYLLIDPLLLQIRKISGNFYQEEGKDIEEIYLTGGTANLPGLKEYFQETFKKKVEIPNCFSDLLYPPILEEKMKKNHFSTKSEFFRNLIRLWMEGKLAEELEESRNELRQGKGKLLKSLKDLR